MDCRNCAYYFEEKPFWGGQITKCLMSGKMIGVGTICMGCDRFVSNHPRRLKKINTQK